MKKILEKKKQRLNVKELLNQGKLPLDCVKSDTFTINYDVLSTLPTNQQDDIQKILYKDDDDDNKKSLSPQLEIIPEKYMNLLELEVFNDINSSKSESSESISVWKDFAKWACFKESKGIIKQFHHHCKLLWSRTQRIHRYIKNEDNKPLQEDEIFLLRPNDKLHIADETTKEIISGNNLKGYHHIFNPRCFKNSLGETMVDFFDLDNKMAAENARKVVDQYYRHTLDHTEHQSPHFKEGLIEHFGGFADSNKVPYTTANTATSHCDEHQKCVRDLIQGLQSVSGSVNEYIKTTYSDYYSKMKELDLGPNVPKSFGIFPTLSINYNVICQFHRDLKDHRNTLCVVCPLGNFTGGELVFPELKLVIHVKQGQAVAFRSNILVHGNLPIITGIRHSLVFYVHNTLIKQKQKRREYLPSKLGSEGSDVTKLKNHRRTHIGMCNLTSNLKYLSTRV